MSIGPSGVRARTPVMRPSLADQIDDLGVHPQIERRVAPAVLGEEIEKIPLRHEGEELAVRRQVREVARS